jgi:mannose-6-phosphate isomerase-like protein (cupin superfamily)
MSNERTPEEKEAFHREAEARVKTFSYAKPAPSERPKDSIPLAHGAMVRVGIQCVRDGGENNLHYHTKSETVWMVKNGRARFYGPGDTLLADLGPDEGIFIPGGARYWFEKVGPEDLEIFQMMGIETGHSRINVSEIRGWMVGEPILNVYEEPAAT